MEEEIQEEVMEDSEEEGGGAYLDLTTDHEGLNPEVNKRRSHYLMRIVNTIVRVTITVKNYWICTCQ